MAFATVGASFVLVIVTTKLSETDTPPESVAVTVTVWVPTVSV